MTERTKIVAYADLLGFSNLVVSDIEKARDLLSGFYNLAQNTKDRNRYNELELFLFSDFLFVQGEDVATVVNYMCHLYRECLLYSGRQEGPPMLCRGGIARGAVIVQKRNEAPNVTKNFIVSPALTHAVHKEKLVDGQRLLISANEREDIQHFWNSQIDSITYDQPGIRPSKMFLRYQNRYRAPLMTEGPVFIECG